MTDGVSSAPRGREFREELEKPRPLGRETRKWEPWLEPYIQQSGDVAVDVGAHIGGYTAALATGYGRVFAFEPNPDLLPLLRQSVEGRENVFIRSEAVSDFTGDSIFYLGQSSEGGGLYNVHPVNGEKASGSIPVKSTRLDDIVFGGKVDFVKIDTEGAELKVVRGAEETLRQFRPRLLVEIHAEENWKAISDILGVLRYEVTVIRNPIYGFRHPYFDRHLWLAATP